MDENMMRNQNAQDLLVPDTTETSNLPKPHVVEAVTVDSLQKAIDNLESHIQWLSGNYKKRCQSLRLKIDRCSDSDLATIIACELPELTKAYQEIESVTEQVKLLGHLADKNKNTFYVPVQNAVEQENDENMK